MKWNYKNETYYEFYDHKFDKGESHNLSNNSSYQLVMDSLKIELGKRVKQASLTPEGVGKQIENAQPTFGTIKNSFSSKVKKLKSPPF